MVIKPINKTEEMYTYTQSKQLQGQTGNIGYLRADFDQNGKGFYSTWFPLVGEDLKLNNDAFKADFNAVIDELRKPSNVLASRNGCRKYCYKNAHPYANDRDFGIKVITDDYVYIMRLCPSAGYYDLYCYCYLKKWLEMHLDNAEHGIRFITSNYDDLFTIIDGGKIQINYSDGREPTTETVRYIDDYHWETIMERIYHIYEFAERMEEIGATVKPYIEKEAA